MSLIWSSISWNADGDVIYSLKQYDFALNPGQQVYTIGPSANADFNTGTESRPAFLEYASWSVTTSQPVIFVPLRILSPDEWAGLRIQQVSATIGNYIYMDGQYPLANVNLYPIPSTTANLVLTVWQTMNDNLVLGGNASIGINLPPAYARAVGLELSIAMAPYYGKSGSADVALMAKQAAALKKKIAFVNLRGSTMVYSSEAQGTGPGASGIYIGQTDEVR